MSLVITGVFDGPLTGGLPKGVELFVTADVSDLSIYGIGSANNGGGTDNQEFTFPAVAALAGTYLYVASEVAQFTAFMGFAPNYTAGAANINGDDAIELFQNGAVIDTFGDINTDGSGQPWEYMDGWAARVPGTAASPTFDISNWSFSGANAFDGEASNASAATPFPTASFGGVTPPTPTFVINEIDADNAGTDSVEFIEIYDGGVGNASLDGLSLVLFNGSSDAEYDTISLDGMTTNETGYFVVGSATVANVDFVAFTTNGLQNGADAVALYEGIAPTAPTTVNLIDAVVYGTGDPDDTGLLTALGLTTQADESANGTSTTDALARQPDGDGDFVAQAPTPGATNFIEPPTVITLISEIQGSGGTGDMDVIGVDDRSAFEGQIVTVSAIVTADFQDGLLGTQGDQNGFYIQEEVVDYDFNDLSSEGIFIFDGTNPDINVNIGDLVEVTGTVSEFFGQTQISATNITVVATEQVVPDSVEVIFPTANVMGDGNGNLVANLEAYEGMLVNVAQSMTVSEMFNLDRFGQYNVTSDGRVVQFSQNNDPDAAGYAQHLRDVAARTLVLDDGQSGQNPDQLKVIDGNDGILTASDSFRMGDNIAAINGVVNYSFGEFRINAADGVYEQANARPAMPEDLGGNFTVASLNVLNYFTTIDESGVTTDNGSDPRGADTAEEFERQAEKLVNAIVAMDADVLGLIEIENDFAGTDFAIKDLVARVNAKLGAEIYAFVDPGQEFVGGDAISNGLIYKQDGVGLKGDMAILETFEGRDFIDPLGAGRGLNRPAIAQTFEDLDTGETITVSVNHFKSKGSLSGLAVDEDQGDGQGNNNATRAEAADILADWLASDPTGQGSENSLILGDLNAYANEDPLTVLADAGYTDLAAQALGEDAYSYVFDGQVGTLDYALANDALADNVVGVTEWHVNADEADALDYNLDFGRDPTLFDGDIAARNSDHDPVIVSFEFAPVYNMIAGTNRRDFLHGTEGRDQIDALKGNDYVFAGGGDDLITGGRGRDKIFGGDGNDDIDAGDGRDIVFGGDGNDIIRSGDGKSDVVFGGEGADTFVFSDTLAMDRSRDKTIIFDFDVDEDVIDLGGAEISNVREFFHSVEIKLDGGRDKIWLLGVDDFDDIVFVSDLAFV
jgi:predicted extracellular nuclease